jgi:hypothetical protein
LFGSIIQNLMRSILKLAKGDGFLADLKVKLQIIVEEIFSWTRTDFPPSC